MFTVKGYTISRDTRKNRGEILLIRQGKQTVSITIEQVDLFIEHIREAANDIDPTIALLPPEEAGDSVSAR